MSVVREIVPVGVGVVVLGAVTFVALDRAWAVGPWLLAVVLLGHGAVHAGFVTPPPPRKTDAPTYPFRLEESWLVSRAGLDRGVVRALFAVLAGLTVLVSLLAALGTVGWLVPVAWWGPLVLTGAGLSTLVLLLGLAPGLVVGFVVNAALVWLVLSGVWAPGS